MFLGADDVEYLPPGLGAEATTATPGTLSMPEDLWNAAQQTNDFINGMASAVAAFTHWTSRTPAGSGVAFDAFRKEWSDFYTNDFSTRARTVAHALTSNIAGNLRNYQEQAATWAKKLKIWGVKVPGIAPASAGGTNVFMWIGIGAVSLVGLFIIGKLIHTVALGNALTEAEDDAVRIANSKRKRRDKTAFSIT